MKRFPASQLPLAPDETLLVTDTNLQFSDAIVREDGRQLVQVGAAFNADQITVVAVLPLAL